jgi:hypothetical protein
LNRPFQFHGFAGAGRNIRGPVAILAATGLLLAPAVWNGFPFMFYDTGAFIAQAAGGGFVAERSVAYAWFLAATGLNFSLWPAMLAQAMMTALVIAVVMRHVAPAASAPAFGRGPFLLVIAVLSVATGLPWYAAQALPDIFAPLLVLCLYLLGFHGHTLSRPMQGALFGVAVLAATSHASHLGLAAGLAAVAALLQAASRSTGAEAADAETADVEAARANWRWPAAAFAAALLAVVVSNYFRTGEVFVSRAGPAFILGRLVQDGLVKRLLDDTCPESGYRLCAYKDNLPPTADDYVWGATSPFLSLGGFEGSAAEYQAIIVESLKRYPWAHLRTAVASTARQFTSFATGDGIEPQHWVLMPTLSELTPHYVDAYTAARQQNGLITFSGLNAVHIPAGFLSLAVLCATLAVAIYHRRRGDMLYLPVFILAALLGNAFICGVLSNPHDRYQSRLMWIASLAAILLAARWRDQTSYLNDSETRAR